MKKAKELESLIEEENFDELGALLRNLNEKERLSLIPTIKRIHKKQYPIKTAEQWQLIAACQLICYDDQTVNKLKDYEISPSFRYLLDWHCPNWISDYINKFPMKHGYSLYYDEILDWTDKGYLIPSSELIAWKVSNIIFTLSHADDSSFFLQGVFDFTTENLLKHPITLEDHIWHLFKHSTNINKKIERAYFQNANTEKANWLEVFKQFTAEGKLDRERVLKECLLATTRNLNKSLTDWFVRLFNELNPDNFDLLNIQEELLQSLNSPNSSAVNNALKLISNIISEKSFKSKLLSNYLPVLLASEVKSIVSNAKKLEKKLI